MATGSDMKERIFKAAFELFSSKGYDKVSLNEVVVRAGVSKGGLFHHFDSKYALARDTLIWWARNHMEPGFKEKINGSIPPQELLVNFIDFMMGIMESEGGFTRFFWSVFDEAMRREDDHAIWIDFLEQYSLVVSRIYKKMGVRDPDMKAMLLLSNMDGMALYHEMMKQTGRELDLEALREEFIRTYVTFKEGAAK